MEWTEVLELSSRHEFAMLASQPGAHVGMLCRRFGFSRTKGYRLLRRFEEDGADGLLDRSRRPHASPARTPERVVQAVLAVRDAHPAWGGLKIRAWLLRHGTEANSVPAPRTIQAILLRHGRIDPRESLRHHPWQRFERDAPNELWQMDFKGHLPTRTGRCHPLTILDDHSRFSIGLFACSNELGTTVRGHLTTVFRRYGLPDGLLVDNGSPWGSAADHPYTPLTVWLLRVGVRVTHARPHHPQTLGKDERFHRTFVAEVVRHTDFRDLAHCQNVFDSWRDLYNLERPHQALDLEVPASRYRPSKRCFPDQLPAIDYGPDDIIRKVHEGGHIGFRGRLFRVPKSFKGYPVALRPTTVDGVFDVWFCADRIAHIDLRAHNENPT